ncbi:MAG: zinc ribbon domain-containing protein [Lachnospiraceae bacterium]|nr:zinc ribbon domain-containing protein [Lachnospiraceae bacterium]
MGFGESFSAFTKGVGEKVKGNAEVMNLRSQINAEQKQINDLKAVLGGKYYDLYKDTASPEPELQETLDAIRYHEQKAMDLEKQAADVRQNTSSVSLKAQPGSGYGEFKSGSAPGNKFCTQCGAPLVDGQAFCVKCGAKI